MMPTNRPESLRSCLYHGHVVHTRHVPFRHTFRHSLFLVYLDLAELETVFADRWLWSTSRASVAWFRRADHLGDADQPLDDCVRKLVHERTGRKPAGPVRLLTHLRYFGYIMNPVSFYFCFDPSDSRVESIVAEVTNTPWGERHCYVITDSHAPTAGPLLAAHAKEFHVSPFMPMDMQYRWRITPPAERLSVQVASDRQGQPVFEASLSLRRRPINSRNLGLALLRHPLMTARVTAAIYAQALRLWHRGAEFHPHPRHSSCERRDSSGSPGSNRVASDPSHRPNRSHSLS